MQHSTRKLDERYSQWLVQHGATNKDYPEATTVWLPWEWLSGGCNDRTNEYKCWPNRNSQEFATSNEGIAALFLTNFERNYSATRCARHWNWQVMNSRLIKQQQPCSCTDPCNNESRPCLPKGQSVECQWAVGPSDSWPIISKRLYHGQQRMDATQTNCKRSNMYAGMENNNSG